MTNTEAIKLIRCAQAEIEWEQPMEYAAAFDKAIEALEEREAAKPKEVNMYPSGQYACGFCGHISVGSKDYHAKYCPECGKAVKWE